MVVKRIGMALFTVIEGADCCGKTTQVEMLAAKLKQTNLGAVGMSFPRYGTPVGKAISRHLKGESQLVNLANDCRDQDDDLAFQALQTLDKYEAAADIEKYLSKGTHVISSRWWQSAVVYGADMGLDLRMLERVHARLPKADLNVLIYLPEEESIARRPELRDRLEKDRERQKRVRVAYRQMWANTCSWGLVCGSEPRRDKDSNYWLVVDGRESEAEVHSRIWKEFLWVMQGRSEQRGGQK
jgi:thymidylate kinase